MSATVAARSVFGSPQIRWAAGGWIFFVAENFVLSENRTALIAHLGDDNYHLLYGTFSTIATGTIGYGYYKLRKLPTSGGGAAAMMTRIAPLNLFTSWGFLSLGLVLASQALPKMQIPISVAGSHDGMKVQVCCPFDFKESKLAAGDGVRGMERVSRHVGFWSFAFIGAGNAALQSPLHPALKLWWFGPALVAWLGGMHTDSRFRRGMGGTLDPWYDSQTSNLPFVAMLSGKQGRPSQAFADLLNETKLLNAACAVGLASVWVLSRGRVR